MLRFFNSISHIFDASIAIMQYHQTEVDSMKTCRQSCVMSGSEFSFSADITDCYSIAFACM